MAYESELGQLTDRMKKCGVGNAELKQVGRAFKYAEETLSGKKFAVGRPFFTHNIAVAKILAELGLSAAVIEAALLHNMTLHGVELKDLEKEFGSEVAGLIEGRLKIKKGFVGNIGERDARHSEEALMLVSKDARAMLVEIAEKIAMLRWFEDADAETQKELLWDSEHIYIPLAQKLGVFRLRTQLEDLVFKYSKPEEYAEMISKIKKRRKEREHSVEIVRRLLRKKLAEAGISADVYGRAKHLCGVYSKMKRQGKQFEEIYDMVAVRVITKNIEDCYKALGVVHANWKALPWEFDDYIAKPKPNNYRSLHTTVIGPDSKPLEVQIRTQEMHNIAEFGAAAHWRYKGMKGSNIYERILKHLRQSVGLVHGTGGAAMPEIKIEPEKEIFVLTPKGRVIELPKGATVLDFAYAVHTDLGNHCHMAKVNGTMSGIGTTLASGDTAEIVTSPKQSPKRNWLAIAKTDKARSRIRGALEIPPMRSTKDAGGGRAFVLKTSDAKVKFANCCMPVAGDEIIGIKTQRKVTVHRVGCPEADKGLRHGVVDVAWDGAKTGYNITIRVAAKDRVGLLSDITGAMAKRSININSSCSASPVRGRANCTFEIKVKGGEDLDQIISSIRKVAGVTTVLRE